MSKIDETTVSFKASLVYNEYVPADDDKIRTLVESLNKLGLKFEYDEVYITHNRGGTHMTTKIWLVLRKQ